MMENVTGKIQFPKNLTKAFETFAGAIPKQLPPGKIHIIHTKHVSTLLAL